MVVDGFKKDVASKALSCAFDAKDELSIDSEKNRTASKGGDAVLICGLLEDNKKSLVSAELSVD